MKTLRKKRKMVGEGTAWSVPKTNKGCSFKRVMEMVEGRQH